MRGERHESTVDSARGFYHAKSSDSTQDGYHSRVNRPMAYGAYDHGYHGSARYETNGSYRGTVGGRGAFHLSMYVTPHERVFGVLQAERNWCGSGADKLGPCATRHVCAPPSTPFFFLALRL
jgi:hypothetical protein